MDISNRDAKKRFYTYSAAFIAAFLWASAFPATRYALQYYSPVSLMVMRFSVASVTLVVIGLLKGMKLPKLKDLPFFAASGLSGVFLYSYLFNTGAVSVSAGVSSFIISSSPVFTIVLARIFLKEVVRPVCWAGILVSCLGLAVITLTQTAGFSFNIGLLLVIGASVSSGVYSAIMRAVTQNYTALEATTYTIIAGTLGTLFFLPTAISEIPDSNVTVNLVVILMGIFPAAIAYLTWSYALSKAEKTAHVLVFSYLIPFISALIAYIWLRETLTVFTICGGLIIIGGMVLTNIFGKEKEIK